MPQVAGLLGATDGWWCPACGAVEPEESAGVRCSGVGDERHRAAVMRPVRLLVCTPELAENFEASLARGR